MSAQAWSLGIDGGASRWKWAIEAAELRWEGEVPGANPNEIGWEPWRTHLAGQVDQIARQIPLDLKNLVSIGLGMAGVGRTAEREGLVDGLRARWPTLRGVWVGHDAWPALVAATGAHSGIVCIAGTGSLAWGCTTSGEEARAGGWGAAWGDEGSGFRIGQQAVTLATRMADGRRPRTGLMDILLKELNLTDPSELIGWARSCPPGEFKQQVAALAPAVLQSADSGDLAARAIRAQALAHLGLMVRAVASQLQSLEASAGAPGPASRPLVCTGGLWAHLGLFDGFRQSLIRLGLSALEPTLLTTSAAWGALRLGREAAR